MEVDKNLLVGIGCSMVAFVHNQVVKIRRRELLQILGNAPRSTEDFVLTNCAKNDILYFGGAVVPPDTGVLRSW